jgi:hypothetical protein
MPTSVPIDWQRGREEFAELVKSNEKPRRNRRRGELVSRNSESGYGDF